MSEPILADREPQTNKIRELIKEFKLNTQQAALLRTAGVRTDAEFYSFLASTTELSEAGLFDSPALTAALSLHGDVQTLIGRTEEEAEVDLQFGAFAPPDAPFPVGSEVPQLTAVEIEDLGSFRSAGPAEPISDELVFSAEACGPWPVRNQERRGTCVSFATIALYELLICSRSGDDVDLSEEFLYWAIKHHNLDGRPNDDGTWFEYAAKALSAYGVCDEATWPYDGAPWTPVSHDPPPAGAQTTATTLRYAGAISTRFSTTHGKASIVLNALKNHNGVGLALPVFDSPNGLTHNWGTRTAQAYGAVQNPMPGWIANGGHAVCCVGFVPDPLEPMGGHFIVRNSWGTTHFGGALPDPSYPAPAPGYGHVTATYVDRYLWEMCVF